MEPISIRSIQHYLYCPHRWGLIEISRNWAENYFVTKANIVHERAHSGTCYTTGDKKVYTSVKIWHDELNLIGEVDCLEFANGIVSIVEYKPTASKSQLIRHEDCMQLFAQKICVDSIFKCNCKTFIYYANTKKRVEIPLEEKSKEYGIELNSILSEITERKCSGEIPPIMPKQYCNGCSFKDLCIPEGTKKSKSISKEIIKFATEETECENY